MTIATPPSGPSASEKFVSDAAKLFPHQGPWTEAEYLALDTSRLVELSDGEVRVVEMATESHQDLLTKFYLSLRDYVDARALGKVTLAPRPMKLWEGKFREPDVMFMLAEHSTRRNEQFWQGADLVMEIVSSDRKHDLETKKSEYARGGIPEYWIIDALLKEVTVLKLAGNVYEPAGVHRPSGQAASVLLPGFVLDVTALFAAE